MSSHLPKTQDYTVQDGQYLNQLKHRIRVLSNEIASLVTVYPYDCNEAKEIRAEISYLVGEAKIRNLSN